MPLVTPARTQCSPSEKALLQSPAKRSRFDRGDRSHGERRESVCPRAWRQSSLRRCSCMRLEWREKRVSVSSPAVRTPRSWRTRALHIRRGSVKARLRLSPAWNEYASARRAPRPAHGRRGPELWPEGFPWSVGSRGPYDRPSRDGRTDARMESVARTGGCGIIYLRR